MLVIFDNLAEATHLDGVWRYPGERAIVADDLARRYAALELATVSDRERKPPADGPPDFSEVTESLYLDARPVDRFPPSRERISVVIPCYRSHAYLPALFASLDGSDETPFDTIVVSDSDGVLDVPGRQVVLSRNCGYAHACNVGASHAAAEFLVLMNADVEVTPGWLTPMLNLLEEQADIAAVGNKHLDFDGRIQSVGSEYDYRTNCFEHVHRGAPDGSHPEICTVTERDVMTAACLCIRRGVWETLGGLDERFRIGYWEDSDLCLRIRERGGRILYCPDSVIRHRQGHSGAARHRFYHHNARLCRRRWVETGKVDRFARRRGRRVHEGEVVACYIVLNEEEYLAASIESVYPLANRIIIVEGGNDFAVRANWCGPDKRSTDRTLEVIAGLTDPEGKIELIQGAWRDKTEQRNAYAARLRPGDWMLLMDGDEVFGEDGLWRLSYLMHHHEVIIPSFWSFWNDFRTVGAGRWDAVEQVKVVRWREGDHYRSHTVPCDAAGRPVTMNGRPKLRTGERLFFHYSWVKPVAKLRRKAEYYEQQVGGVTPDYIDRVFLGWRRDPKAVEQRHGTHPFGGGGTTSFTAEHPEPIRRRIDAGELGGEGW